MSQLHDHGGGDPLAELRPYHLPEAVGWWPPAPGWWALAVALTMLALGLAWWLRRRRLRRAAANQALLELGRLRSALRADMDTQVYLRGVSRLLRRFAISRFRRTDVAGLTGADWLAFLDAHGGAGRFQGDAGRLLTEGPYRPADATPVEELHGLVESWIRRNREAWP